ncbi:MAG: class II aldolase/adducin family protein [Candidatus Woesearchaeota archaeon]|nr:MAG: class II aldolase/adducin family protein [Candidatus Woesearchaeota archaeon]
MHEKVGDILNSSIGEMYLGDLVTHGFDMSIEEAVENVIGGKISDINLARYGLSMVCWYLRSRYHVPLLNIGAGSRSTGNVSLRLDDDKYTIKPSGEDFRTIRPMDFIIINKKGEKLEGELKPSIETLLHLSTYEKRPDVNAIIHTHSPNVVLLSRKEKKDLYVEDHDNKEWLAKATFVPYEKAGSKELATAVSEALINNNVAIMEDHGLISAYPNLGDAVDAIEVIDEEAALRLIEITPKEERAPLRLKMVIAKHFQVPRNNQKQKKFN